jgi:hypothetical protein
MGSRAVASNNCRRRRDSDFHQHPQKSAATPCIESTARSGMTYQVKGCTGVLASAWSIRHRPRWTSMTMRLSFGHFTTVQTPKTPIASAHEGLNSEETRSSAQNAGWHVRRGPYKSNATTSGPPTTRSTGYTGSTPTTHNGMPTAALSTDRPFMTTAFPGLTCVLGPTSMAFSIPSRPAGKPLLTWTFERVHRRGTWSVAAGEGSIRGSNAPSRHRGDLGREMRAPREKG